jgi:thioester reductase-like protein
MIFVTGFPGFLASQLVPRLLSENDRSRVTCLVERHQMDSAQRLRLSLPSSQQHRLHLVDGDITRDGLGLDVGAVDMEHVREIFHLAAVYDLAVSREVATAVNLMGTRHMLDFAHGCGASLTRFHYVSTCYVSGRFEGVFTEAHLVCGQAFNNYYEESKYRAEVEVQAAMQSGMPITIYRPSVVVGDSSSGAIPKFDGPYPLIRWLLRFPSLAVLPTVGNIRQHYVNFVPSDFVTDALHALSRMPSSLRQVYHLSDPHPLPVKRAIELLGKATGRRVARLPLPMPVARRIVGTVGKWDRSLGLDPSIVDYFQQRARYTSENTERDLAGTGIVCPPFSAYVDRIVDYVRTAPRERSHLAA